MFHGYTGSWTFLLPPARVSNTCLMYGPTTGMFPVNWPTVIRKSPNKMKIPYSSIKKPVKGHRRRMRMIPEAKAAVPLSFWRREKKFIVFWRPIISVKPMRKSIYQPLANSSSFFFWQWLSVIDKKFDKVIYVHYPWQAYKMRSVYKSQGHPRSCRLTSSDQRTSILPNIGTIHLLWASPSTIISFRRHGTNRRAASHADKSHIPPEQKITPISIWQTQIN